MDTITPDISASPPDADMRPLAEILETLSRVRQPFPETAMQAAIARREEITPPLLEALRRLVHNPKWNAGDCLWFYGVHLLAQFREPAAYEPLLEICRWPTKDIDTVLEDMVTETLPHLLYSVCHGRVQPLLELMEDERADPWVRAAVIRVLQAEAAAGSSLEAELRERYRRLLEKAIGDVDRCRADPSIEYDDIVPTRIAVSAAAMYFRELLPLLKEAYDGGALDRSVMFWKDYEGDLAPGLSEEAKAKNRSGEARIVEDAAGEMRDWACFDEPEEEDCDEDEDDEVDRRADAPGYLQREPATIIRDKPKVGPNQPCPCGSGKKHKKCCGR